MVKLVYNYHTLNELNELIDCNTFIKIARRQPIEHTEHDPFCPYCSENILIGLERMKRICKSCETKFPIKVKNS